MCWGETLQMSSENMRDVGVDLGFAMADIAASVRQATLDTAEVARLLGCGRQNVSDLVRRGRLVPIKSTARGPLFLRGDVYARLDL